MYDPTQPIHQGHLIDIDIKPVQFLEFQYNPGSIKDRRDTQYSENRTPGASHPNQQFIGGGVRQITFKLDFFMANVKSNVAWLQSLTYPENAGGILKKAPHRVIFSFGRLYPNMVCIMRKVDVNYFELFHHETLDPHRAEVDIVLEEYVEETVNYLTTRRSF